MLGETTNLMVHKHCIETGHRSPDINVFKL